MAKAYPMPKWGVTMEEGLISEWTKSPGDHVKEGDVIGVVSSDKVEVDFEAPADGVIAKFLADAGDTVDCGTEVFVLADDDEDYKKYVSNKT